jgi:hypothetical protein
MALLLGDRFRDSFYFFPKRLKRKVRRTLIKMQVVMGKNNVKLSRLTKISPGSRPTNGIFGNTITAKPARTRSTPKKTRPFPN